ncbi:MAG: iron-containing alcohol dehydrogenase, partial [Candidatus Glassbacteria bacterium]
AGRGSARRHGLLDRLEKSLREKSLPYELFEGVEAEPALETAEEAAGRAKKAGCDVFIGIGGGSVIDTVKLVAMLQDNPGPAEDYQLGRRDWTAGSKPVIAIPTTAGTGSEATKVSVMTNRRLKVKKALYSWEMVATVALLDGEACLNMPPEVTRDTGLDALGQAIEGYLSTSANSLTMAAAAGAVRLVRENLPAAVAEGKNVQARHNMLVASLLGGVAIDTGVGLGHEMAMAVGSYKGLGHGLLVGVLTPPCLEANLGWADSRLAELAWHFGCPHADNPQEMARSLIAEIRRFGSGIGLPASLGELGVAREEIGAILEASKLSTNIRTNPRPLDDRVRSLALEAAISG